jgi:hypothetical protein
VPESASAITAPLKNMVMQGSFHAASAQACFGGGSFAHVPIEHAEATGSEALAALTCR